MGSHMLNFMYHTLIASATTLMSFVSFRIQNEQCVVTSGPTPSPELDLVHEFGSLRGTPLTGKDNNIV